MFFLQNGSKEERERLVKQYRSSLIPLHFVSENETFVPKPFAEHQWEALRTSYLKIVVISSSELRQSQASPCTPKILFHIEKADGQFKIICLAVSWLELPHHTHIRRQNLISSISHAHCKYYMLHLMKSVVFYEQLNVSDGCHAINFLPFFYLMVFWFFGEK